MLILKRALRCYHYSPVTLSDSWSTAVKIRARDFVFLIPHRRRPCQNMTPTFFTLQLSLWQLGGRLGCVMLLAANVARSLRQRRAAVRFGYSTQEQTGARSQSKVVYLPNSSRHVRDRPSLGNKAESGLRSEKLRYGWLRGEAGALSLPKQMHALA